MYMAARSLAFARWISSQAGVIASSRPNTFAVTSCSDIAGS